MAEEHDIRWQHDFEAALNDSSTGTRHVLLDFTAAPM